MYILSLLVVVTIALGLLAVALVDHSEFGGEVSAFVAIASLVATFIVAVVLICTRASFTAEVAQVEAVRTAVASCDKSVSHGIYLEVVQTNEVIASNQAWLKRWWARDFVHPGWANVRTIEFK